MIKWPYFSLSASAAIVSDILSASIINYSDE